MNLAEVEFNYKGTKVIIRCKENEIMKNICQSFKEKVKEDKNNLYFLYIGSILDENLTFEQMINSEDKKRNRMSILVFKNELKEEELYIIKSKVIICPICGESIKIDIKDYKITLFECKNNHKIENILLDEFENTQIIDNKKIICEICKKKIKLNTFMNTFYKCCECEKNICVLCKLKHDRSHKIINYDDKLYICNKHYENYYSYCQKCKINLCILCEGEHISHEKISLGDIILKKEELDNKKNSLKNKIDLFINEIELIINILKEVINKMNIYYKINEDIINNYINTDFYKRNYEILYNINKIFENNIEKELENIKNSDFKNKFNYIFNIYKNMNYDEINIIYKAKENDNEVKIFGSDFVERNKNRCKIIYEGKEEELKEKKEIYTSWFSTKINKLEIKLKGILNITDISGMFYECSKLSSLPDISKWNTIIVTHMRNMFYGCSSLSSLPDISKWNTSNVIDMRNMFYGCSSLSSLPDISKWNTSNVIDISSIFYKCPKLSSLPDISKWDSSNVNNMSGIFDLCLSLSSLPDISKWNTSNVIDMRNMFYGCSSLLSLPDISKWNTSNVTDMNYMFSECSKLSSLPDISKWNTSNVTNMRNMFLGCSSLSSLPDISKWNTSKVTDMNYMLYKCSKLSSLPDISKWNTSNVADKRFIFDECNKSLKIPKFKQ